MCFIRKGLDFIFTQNELKYLDDILPGSKVRKSKRSVFRVSSVPDMPNKVGCSNRNRVDVSEISLLWINLEPFQ